MLKAQIIENSIEVRVPRGDLLLVATSAALGVALVALAGWRVAGVALALSIGGGALVTIVQRIAADRSIQSID